MEGCWRARTTTIALLLLIVLVGLSAYVLWRMPSANTEDDIREVLYRYLFTHNGSAVGTNASAYYLSIGRFGDPSDRLLRRFAGHRPPVLPQSESDEDSHHSVCLPKTGAPAVILITGSIRWISSTEVEVTGGYHEGSLSGSEAVYRLIRRHGKWVVVSERLRWVS